MAHGNIAYSRRSISRRVNVIAGETPARERKGEKAKMITKSRLTTDLPSTPLLILSGCGRKGEETLRKKREYGETER